MTDAGNQDHTGIANAFLVRYLEDLDRDSVGPVEIYQREFPGYEDLIARKYAELHEGVEAVAPETGLFEDELGVGTELSPLDEACREVGPYILRRCLGEGGMGAVYLAEQREPIRRVVALKMIKLGMSTREIIARFEAERQALALMNHPNIARVFDAGTAEDGRPYFVMEYVPGSPVTNYCDRHRLRLEQRLELFAGITDGVGHAHQKGVLHRDLKPNNILVRDEDGRAVPKIIDFGIAKSLAEPLAAGDFHTRSDQVIGTPHYMSPEQLETGGEDVDTRADIYALGVVLYELVTGVLPFENTGARVDLAARLRELETLGKPSLRVSRLGQKATPLAHLRQLQVAGLLRRLRGELDWITMKALEGDRSRRYASVSDLGADIRRYLRHEPVLAGPPTTRYRLSKWARRHRRALVFATVLLAVGVSALVVAGVLEDAEQRRESRGLFASGIQSWGRNAPLAAEVRRLEENWRLTHAEFEDWEPVWRREKEHRLWEELEVSRRRRSENFSQSLVEFYSAFEKAPLGSSERREAYRKIRLLHETGDPEGTYQMRQTLPPEFFTILFRDAGFADIDAQFDAWEPLRVESDPSGAEVYCFRYEMLEGRLFPHPYGGVARESFKADVLRVDALVDVDVDVDGDAVGERTHPFEFQDHIRAVDRRPVRLLREFVDVVATATVGQSLRVEIERNGRAKTVDWTPFPVARNVDDMESLRAAFGFDFSGYPLDLNAANRLGTTPLRLPLPRGSYLLVLRREGRVATRLPLVVPRLRREDDRQRVALLRPRQVPPGFVLVSAGRFFKGGDPKVHQSLSSGTPFVGGFLMSRLEVTVAEYGEFLNAPENYVRIDVDGEAPPVSDWVRQRLVERPTDSVALKVGLVPRSRSDKGLLYELNGGRWEPRSSRGYGSSTWPVLGVSTNAAAEYAAWRTRQSGGLWNFRLPTDLEWEKAARGVDGRFFVWGNYPTWSFCRSARGNRGRSTAVSVGVYPMDESVYGIRDLAGNASEPTTDITEGHYRSVRGGNWYAFDDYFFRVANRNGAFPWSRYRVDQGIRLVADFPAD